MVVLKIGSERNSQGIGIHINRRIRLFIKEGDDVFPRDGILLDFDESHLHVEMLRGSKAGKTLSFLRTSVWRIDPLEGRR